VQSAVLGFILLGSLAYSLYIGYLLKTDINPWTKKEYTFGTVFTVSLIMIQGGIAAVELISEFLDFKRSFSDSSIVHESLLKTENHSTYPTRLSFNGVYSPKLKNVSFELSGVVAIVSAEG